MFVYEYVKDESTSAKDRKNILATIRARRCRVAKVTNGHCCARNDQPAQAEEENPDQLMREGGNNQLLYCYKICA
jgi:hypothetical protein